MEQITEKQTPTGKIYKAREIEVGTFIGGPLVAGYFIAENFKAFNQHDKAKRTWIITIIVTILIFGGIFLIPDQDKIPYKLIPIIYTGITILIVSQFQKKNIKNHLDTGGKINSWGRTIFISVIGLIIIIVPLFSFTYFSDTYESADITTKNYGLTKNEIDFDVNNISVREIDNIADSFRKTLFFDIFEQKFVYAKKLGSTYELSISCNSSLKTNPEAVEEFILLQKKIQRLFPYNKIVLNLVVDDLDNIVKRIE
jgi:hypothetical protein